MAKNNEKLLNQFIRFCRKYNIDKGLVATIPFVGSGLKEVLYGGKIQKEISSLKEDLIAQLEEHSDAVENIMRIMSYHEKGLGSIITVGSGVAEYVFQSDERIIIGEKHLGKATELFGGSGVNYTMRLIGADFDVYPLLSIGKDNIGMAIQKILLDNIDKFGGSVEMQNFIKSEEFLPSGIVSSRSTILVSGTQRTVLSQKQSYSNDYKDFLNTRISILKKMFPGDIGAVMIGHIYADLNEEDESQNGKCTKLVIQAFKDKSLLYANIGTSQIKLGAKYWEKELSLLSVLQLNCTEVKSFFLSMNLEDNSLLSILNWFKEKAITVVITLDKFGAIGSYKGGKHGVILAWPLNIDVVDSTGAGDAFASGMVSRLIGNRKFSFAEFHASIEIGRTWAAFACKSIGAASYIPKNEELESFHDEIYQESYVPVEVRPWKEAERFIDIFDRAFG